MRGNYMKVSYNGLWKILIDKNMNKKELTEVCELSPATVSKMGRGEFVSMDVLYRIGTKLDADFGEMVSIIRESNDE
jgi:DNA-binding Xre family transcriptional regulator